MRICSKLHSEGHSQGKFCIWESSIKFGRKTNSYAALPYTEYPLRMLKFEIRAEITEYDANGRGGACTKRCLAKALRMLADPYRCLKNVAIDYHPHKRILENALRMFRTLTNAVTNNTNVLQTPYK